MDRSMQISFHPQTHSNCIFSVCLVCPSFLLFPSIDPVSLLFVQVMSLQMAIGRRGHVLNSAADDDATRVVALDSPVLHAGEMETIKDPKKMNGLKTGSLSTLFDKSAEGGLKMAVEKLCEQVRY